MAYTKAPTGDTHNVTRIPPTESVIIQSSTTTVPSTNTYTNCYPLEEGQWQNEPILGIHKRDGWSTWGIAGATAVGTGSAGASWAQSALSTNNLYFFTFGKGLYSINYGITSTVTLIDNSTTYNYMGTLTNAINNSNVRKIACLEGLNGINTSLTLCNDDGSGVTVTNIGTLYVDGARGLVFIDGYLFAVNSDGNKIYNSAAGGVLTTWNSTDFLDAEQYADPIVYIEKHKNYLVAFGTQSIEFFYNNAVEVGSPLARQESYASRVGLYLGSAFSVTQNAQKYVAQVKDDIYFIGRSETDNLSLYRIKDFRVEEINTENQYVKNLLNTSSLGISNVFPFWLNNNLAIVVEFLNSGGSWAYMVETNTWVKLTGSDIPSASTNLIGKPFVSTYAATGNAVKPYYLAGAASAIPRLYSNDTASTSVTATYVSQPLDMGNNRYKHIARVDVIGDFNANSLTLSYGESNNYTASPVSCGSQTSSTIGYKNNISWYNLGAFRQFYLVLSMTGAYPGIFRGFEIEYNVGVA